MTEFCDKQRRYIAQQMVHSTIAFRGGSVFSLRVFFHMTSSSPMKVVWHKTRAAYQLFANRPGDGRLSVEQQYVTNQHARAKENGSKTLSGVNIE